MLALTQVPKGNRSAICWTLTAARRQVEPVVEHDNVPPLGPGALEQDREVVHRAAKSVQPGHDDAAGLAQAEHAQRVAKPGSVEVLG
jgi:hypothetical protein